MSVFANIQFEATNITSKKRKGLIANIKPLNIKSLIILINK